MCLLLHCIALVSRKSLSLHHSKVNGVACVNGASALSLQWTKARETQQFTPEQLEQHFARNHERRMALKVIEQKRKLPPLLNERAVHTRAATYGDKYDQFYHSPSSRIGSNYSMPSERANGDLLEQFPQVRGEQAH